MFKLRLNLIHYGAMVKRYLALILSDKLSFITLLLQAPIMVVLIKLTCNKDFSYYNAMMTLFVVVVIITTMSILNSYREITKEREIIKREVQSGLDTKSYIISKITVQSIIALYQSIVIASGVLIFVDVPLDPNPGYRIFMLYFVCFLTYMASVSFGLCISSIVKSSDSAVLPVLFIIVAQVVLSGALMDLPKEISFLSVITIAKWSCGALGGIFDIKGIYLSYYGGNENPYDPLRGIYNVDFRLCILMLVMFIVVFLLLSIIFIRRNLKK